MDIEDIQQIEPHEQKDLLQSNVNNDRTELEAWMADTQDTKRAVNKLHSKFSSLKDRYKTDWQISKTPVVTTNSALGFGNKFYDIFT